MRHGIPGIYASREVGRGLVLLHRQVATGSTAASVDFIGIDGKFEEYFFTFTDIVPQTDAQVLWGRISLDNGGTFKAGASDYRNTRFGNIEGTTSAAGSAGDTKIIIGLTAGNSTGETTGGWVWLPNPSNTSLYKTIFSVNGGVNATPALATNHNAGAYVTATSAINGFQFLMASGNINGIFKMYGLNPI